MSRRFVDSSVGGKQKAGQGITDLSNQFELQQKGLWPNDASATSWMRPKDWLAIPSVSSNEQKVIGLFAVYEGTDTSAVAFVATVSGTGTTYTVDWGDGTSNTYSSGAQASKLYNYSTISNSTISSRGYKQVLITITPQSGNNLLTLNLNQKYPFTVAPARYCTNWLELYVNAAQLATLQIRYTNGGTDTANVWHHQLEKITIANNKLTNCSYLFRELSNLKSLEMNSSSATNMTYFLAGCISIKEAPQLNTSLVTNMNYMFSGCSMLNYVPLYDTSSVTNMSRMFESCDSLETIPKFNTANVTDMSYMFYMCRSLKTVPLLNTINVTNMQYMFGFSASSTAAGCMETIPLFNTSNVTNMTSMFYYRLGLERLPLLDMNKVTDLTNFTTGCASLIYLPNFNTSKVVNFSGAFNSVNALPVVPALDMSNATNVSGFSSMDSVTKTNVYGARYVSFAPGGNIMSATEINNFYSNLGNSAIAGYSNTTTSAPISRSTYLTGSYASGTYISKGTTTVVGGTNVITVGNNTTNSITAGMEMLSGTNFTAPVTAELRAGGTNTVYRPNHGLSNGSMVSFSNIVTASGSSDPNKMWTGYYVSSNFGNFGTPSAESQNMVYANGVWAMATTGGIWTTTTPHLTNSWTRVLTGSWNTIDYGIDSLTSTGYWVVAGGSGAIQYTTQSDASTGWTSVTASNVASNTIYSVRFINNYWIATAGAGRYSYTSFNPLGDWTGNQITGYTSSNLKSIDWNGTYFVIVSNSINAQCQIFYKTSTPGGTWSNVSIPSPTYEFKKVKWVNSCWVIVSDDRLIYKASSDPSGTWTNIYYDTINASQYAMFNFDFDGNYWVVACSAGTIWSQPAGVSGTPPAANNWTRIHQGWAANTDGGVMAGTTSVLYFNNNASYKWFAASSSISAGTFNGSGLDVYTPYYVINATTNDFQLSSTSSGTTPITITQSSITNTTGTNGCGMLHVPVVVSATATAPGTITLSVPASGSGTTTLQTFTFASASPKRSIARLKGWTVNS